MNNKISVWVYNKKTNKFVQTDVNNYKDLIFDSNGKKSCPICIGHCNFDFGSYKAFLKHYKILEKHYGEYLIYSKNSPENTSYLLKTRYYGGKELDDKNYYKYCWDPENNNFKTTNFNDFQKKYFNLKCSFCPCKSNTRGSEQMIRHLKAIERKCFVFLVFDNLRDNTFLNRKKIEEASKLNFQCSKKLDKSKYFEFNKPSKNTENKKQCLVQKSKQNSIRSPLKELKKNKTQIKSQNSKLIFNQKTIKELNPSSCQGFYQSTEQVRNSMQFSIQNMMPNLFLNNAQSLIQSSIQNSTQSSTQNFTQNSTQNFIQNTTQVLSQNPKQEIFQNTTQVLLKNTTQGLLQNTTQELIVTNNNQQVPIMLVKYNPVMMIYNMPQYIPINKVLVATNYLPNPIQNVFGHTTHNTQNLSQLITQNGIQNSPQLLPQNNIPSFTQHITQNDTKFLRQNMSQNSIQNLKQHPKQFINKKKNLEMKKQIALHLASNKKDLDKNGVKTPKDVSIIDLTKDKTV